MTFTFFNNYDIRTGFRDFYSSESFVRIELILTKPSEE